MSNSRRSPFCSALLLLFFCLHVLPASSQSIKQNPTQAERLRSGHERLALAFDLLRERGVPFDPELLIDDNWRSEIEPALRLMPEMRETRKLDRVAKGVYLADTVLVPQRVALAGDTFILCRDFAAEDENTTIKISGHHSLFIYVIGDPKINAAMVQSARRGFPPMRLDLDVMAPGVLVGIPPHFIGSSHIQGRSSVPGGGLAQVGPMLMPDSRVNPSGLPHLLDPDFEAFRLASDPLLGWYSEAADDSSEARAAWSPDAQIKVQGRYSLRLEQHRAPKKGEQPVSVGQVVRVMPQGGVTRTFNLSVQARGDKNGQLAIAAYVVDQGDLPRLILQRNVKLQREWKVTI